MSKFIKLIFSTLSTLLLFTIEVKSDDPCKLMADAEGVLSMKGQSIQTMLDSAYYTSDNSFNFSINQAIMNDYDVRQMSIQTDDVMNRQNVSYSKDCGVFNEIQVLSIPFALNEENEILVYPNPVAPLFNIKSPVELSSAKNYSLSVMEVTSIKFNKVSATVLRPSLERGLYLMQIFDKKLRLLREVKLQIVQ